MKAAITVQMKMLIIKVLTLVSWASLGTFGVQDQQPDPTLFNIGAEIITYILLGDSLL